MKKLIMRISIVTALVLIITSIFTLPAIALEPGEPGYIGEFCHYSTPGLDTDRTLELEELGEGISSLASPSSHRTYNVPQARLTEIPNSKNR